LRRATQYTSRPNSPGRELPSMRAMGMRCRQRRERVKRRRRRHRTRPSCNSDDARWCCTGTDGRSLCCKGRYKSRRESYYCRSTARLPQRWRNMDSRCSRPTGSLASRSSSTLRSRRRKTARASSKNRSTVALADIWWSGTTTRRRNRTPCFRNCTGGLPNTSSLTTAWSTDSPSSHDRSSRRTTGSRAGASRDLTARGRRTDRRRWRCARPRSSSRPPRDAGTRRRADRAASTPRRRRD
jgi:hypothetical protein